MRHFEALVAEIAAKFIQHFDPKRERCWIAEKDGEIVGSVFLVKKSKTVAKLRLLLVEPSARGLGIGKRLVDECLRFARQVGYKKMVLWTQSELPAARHIYQEAGFRLVQQKKHHSWGRDDLVSEIWELKMWGGGGRPKWNVHPHAPSLAHQPPLQVAADAVEHLKLKGVARDIFQRGKYFGLIDDLLVVRRQAVIDAALHQNFHQPDVIRIHL